MKTAQNPLDAFAVGLATWMIRLRLLIIPIAIVGCGYLASFASNLAFDNNYRAFFSKGNPELQAFEELQSTYTKTDNFLLVMKPRDDSDVFTRETLAAVQYGTEEGWLTPYTQRVDSISNFQHSYAIGDELIVEDLIDDLDALSDEDIARKREVAFAEPLLNGALLSPDGRATAVNIVVQYPEKSLSEVPEAVAYARELRARIEEKFPNIDVSLTGTSALNTAFSEASLNDFGTLVPAMFVVILIATALAVRSVSATLATLVLIILSATAAMGFGGLIGVKLAGPSPSAPIIILTLAIADSIHILISMRSSMRDGLEKRDAIIEAIRVNFLPVMVTSITTMVGFLSLHLSDSPPFRDLGTLTATGILFAWLLSMTLLPALLSLAPIRTRALEAGAPRSGPLSSLAEFVIARARLIFVVTGLGALALIVNIPSIQLSDQWREYFAPRIEFRAETDKAIEFFGLYPVEFSVPAAGPGGVSDPAYLEKLEDFTAWLREQPNVTHVFSLSDIMKRLNRNLNADDPAFYKLPDDRELSAQYLLLYEISLPYGLDLNDRINIDKSATRVTATVDGDITSMRLREFFGQARAWFAENAPEYAASPTGAQVMFTYIAQRNVESMVRGTAIAIVAIAIIMIVALRSISMGLVSLVPNALPILAAFGVWALLIGEVGFSVAAIAAISLGIVIDDTVHYLTKFVRARRDKGLNTPDSIRYAFNTVGVAIVVNTIILAAGFIVLTFSAFKINVEMGLLTSITIGLALVLDFLFLPAMLLLFTGKSDETSQMGEDYVAADPT